MAKLHPKTPHAVPFLSRNPSGNIPIEAQIENRYYDHFQQKTATDFQGIMDWTIWKHLVLQLSHQEPFVRDSVVAIGALIRSLESRDDSKELLAHDGGPFGMPSMHQQYALLKYGKAVTAMQRLVDPSLRHILVSCLLVFCFEILLNNRTSALPHIITGHRMLQDFLSKHPRSTQIDRILHSPEPATIDDELIDAFEHLDLQISTIYDVRPIEMHHAIISSGKGVIEHMPSTFSTLIDAGRYLAVVMKQSHHFLATAWPSTCPETLVAEFVTTPPGALPVVSGVNFGTTSYVVPDSLRVEQKPYADDVMRWSQAFEPAFHRIQLMGKVASKSYVMSAMLKLQAISTSIMVASVLIIEELDYELFLPQFQEMMTLINIIVNAHQKVSDETDLGIAGFVLGLGILAPLYLLVTRCRDRAIRREGIEILERWHREACWDPFIVAEIGKFILDVEEEGNAQGVIPESSRAVITRVCEAPATGAEIQKALIQLVQRRGGPDGGPMWKERMVYFGSRRKPKQISQATN